MAANTSEPNHFCMIVFLLLAGMAFLPGCGPSSDGSKGPASLYPPEPGPAAVIVKDARSDGDHGNWRSQYLNGGVWADAWFANQYERPFSALDMAYQPQLDILEARVRPGEDWTVFEVQVVSSAKGEKVYISLELDTDLDNRPDLLILTRVLEEITWNDGMITILVDPNRDAGGDRPRLAEPYNEAWNGFEDSYDARPGEGSKAFVRRSPESDSTYQIALANELLGGGRFVWRVWLEGGIFHPGWVEYNDHFTLEEAGSPYLFSPNYPLKALASLDNTCLHFYGGDLAQPQAGYCGTIIGLSGEELLPPDDQYTDPAGEEPIAITFPGGSDTPEPGSLVFDPGYFFQPTPTPRPHLDEFPTMEFVVPSGPQDGTVVVVLTTPLAMEVVTTTPLMVGVVTTTPLVMEMVTLTPTDMFDPYQGASPTPTPRPIFVFDTPTPTP